MSSRYYNSFHNIKKKKKKTKGKLFVLWETESNVFIFIYALMKR